MARAPKPPTAWDRARPAVILVLFVAAVLAAIFWSFGIAGLLLLVALGLATFGGGGPSEGGFYESRIGIRGP